MPSREELLRQRGARVDDARAKIAPRPIPGYVDGTMLTLTEICAAGEHADGVLVLPFLLRQKSRLRAVLASGEVAALMLPRGTVLRGGDCLRGEDGRIVRVMAATEQVYRVDCSDQSLMARCAYHLGNRHVPMQIGDRWLRIERDAVLKEMVEGLGAQVSEENAPFEPEGGAYGGAHAHVHAPLPQHASALYRPST